MKVKITAIGLTAKGRKDNEQEIGFFTLEEFYFWAKETFYDWYRMEEVEE